MDADARKEAVRRFAADVVSGGRLEVLDEVFTPEGARAARAWVRPFLRSFTDIDMRLVELVAEGPTVVGRFACSGTHTRPWRGHDVTDRRFTDIDEVYFFTFEGHRIARMWGLEDTWERMRQLDLVEA